MKSKKLNVILYASNKTANKSNSADAANMARHFAAAKAVPCLLHS
jgi:hypothetical protein